MAKQTDCWLIKLFTRTTSKKYGTPAVRVIWVNTTTLEQHITWIDQSMANYEDWMSIIDDPYGPWGLYVGCKKIKRVSHDGYPVVTADSNVKRIAKIDKKTTEEVLNKLRNPDDQDFFDKFFTQ